MPLGTDIVKSVHSSNLLTTESNVPEAQENIY
jgi:hypothetical protein